ncbi:9601_t:CDS:1, partial [Paraglomus brasilianum]
MPEEAKVKAIKDFLQPKNLKTLRGFLGLAGFYRKFMKDSAKTAASLFKLLKNKETFKWEIGQQHAFDTLKKSLITAP